MSWPPHPSSPASTHATQSRPHLASPQSYIQPHSPESRDDYCIGDIYNRISSPASAPLWRPADPASQPYLAFVQKASQNWPYIRYLADFMEVSCAPPMIVRLTEHDKRERRQRLKIAMLDFMPQKKIQRTTFENLVELQGTLQRQLDHPDEITARLFVVEDLSSDVIETLGGYLNIPPAFFRGHMSDYMWYNTRDPWVELPELEILAAKRSYFHMRYVQPRYFRTQESVQRAKRELGGFNVLRRLDTRDDSSHTLDQPGSVVGMVRCKASLWIRPNKQNEAGVLGIFLVDPTITEGFPLWGGYNDLSGFLGTDAVDSSPRPAPGISMFEELIYWTGTLTNEEIAVMEKDHRLLAKKALVLICSNWLTTLEYATTRIAQIEWEIEKPTLRLLPKSLEASLKRLHRWRRVLPIYHGMVSDTLRKVIKREHFLLATDSQISELRPDFESVLDRIAALQTRSEKIVSLVTAMISIEESQKAVQQNENLTRLTYLACVFIPLSFLSSLFSMQGDLDQLKKTFRIYFVIAVPLIVVSLLLIRFVYSNRSNFWKAARPEEPV